MRRQATRTLCAVREESGFVLFQVLAFSMLLAMITFALANLSLSEYASVKTVDRGSRAFFIADGAVERAITVLRADSNWSDNLGADQNANSSSWQPLYDRFQAGGPGNALNQAYPAGGDPAAGQYSVYIRRPDPNSGLNPVDNIYIRAIGQASSASRAVEVLLHRMSPLDFSVYAAQPLTSGNGGGSVTMHGSAYFYQDVGSGPVRTTVYNDRQILSGDAGPYLNQVYVRGTLNMSTGNALIGSQTQPMYGVHATNIDLLNGGGQSLFTQEMDNTVPSIPFPNVQQFITASIANGSYGNLLSSNQQQMAICTKSGNMWNQTFTPDLTFGATYFVVPTQSYATCDTNVTAAANNMLIWNPGQAVSLQLNSAFKETPIAVPGMVNVSQNITYSGTGTFLVESIDGHTGLNSTGGQILATVPASGSACGFAGPSTMPQTDLLGFIVASNVAMQGSSSACAGEQDVVVVAGSSGSSTFSSTNPVQLYGLLIANQIDASQNPAFYQMPDMLQFLPAPIYQLATSNATMPVVIRQWRELMY